MKPSQSKPILWSMVWAIAFIASAIVFKGNPEKEWIQAALFVVGLTAWLWQSRVTEDWPESQ